jgi:hypothetical protein
MITISGWVSAFCFWTGKGKRIWGTTKEDCKFDLTPFAARKQLFLDGVEFPIIPVRRIPAGVLPVPVTVMDENSQVYETTMIAGSVGMTASLDQTTFQVRSRWWMVEDPAEDLKG